MNLATLSAAALLLGLAAGLTVREIHSFAPPEEDPFEITIAPEPIAASSAWRSNEPLVAADLQALPAEARRQAELYLFLQRATPQELIDHWNVLLQDKDAIEESLADFASLWVERDPENALAHLSKSRFQDLYWWTFGRHDPQKALAQVDPEDAELFAKVLAAAGSVDPDLALSFFSDDLKGDRDVALGGIIAGLFERDPEEALDFAFQHRSRFNYHLGDHLDRWALQDPRRAFAWALAHPEIQKDHLSSLGPILLNHDPDFFSQEFAKLPTGKPKAELLEAQAIHLAHSDPQAALSFADQQSPLVKNHILQEIGATVIRDNPDLALEVLSTLVTHASGPSSHFEIAYPGGLQPFSSDDVWNSDWAKSLAASNPETVMEFTTAADMRAGAPATNSSDPLRIWLDVDPGAARSWLAEQAPGEVRDYLNLHAANQLGGRDPSNIPSHLALPDQIQSSELRQDAFNDLFKAWEYGHSEGLQNYLKDHALTPEQQKAYNQRGDQ